MKRLLFLLLIVIASEARQSYAQNLDSLWKVYNNKSQADTNRLNAINTIARNFSRNNPDTAIILAEREIELANSLSNERGKLWVGNAYLITAISYKTKSNDPKALDYSLKGLKIFEELGNKQGMGKCYNNIGNVYHHESNYAKSLELQLKALNIYEEINDKHGIGYCYIFIGNIYDGQSNILKALEYQTKALKILEEVGDKQWIAACYINIGIINSKQHNYTKAREYYVKSLRIKKEIKDIKGITYCYLNLCEAYIDLSDYKLAMLYNDSGLQLCKDIGFIEGVSSAYKDLSIIYSKTNKFKEAYSYQLKYQILNDSVFNGNNSKKLNDITNNFEAEKREAEQSKLDAIAVEEKQKQLIIIYAIAGVLLIVIIFSILLYRRFILTNKQKAVIEDQKVLVDKAYESLHEKNKEVMDSIRYAKRIQTALITSEKYINNALNRLMK